MNVKINAQALEEKLKAEYLGKKVGYGASEIRWTAYRLIQEELKAQGLSDEELRLFNTTDQRKSFNQSITYRGHIIGEIMIKRAKGQHHHSYWGNGYNDYTYKDIHVELDDLSIAIPKIDGYEQSLIDKKNSDLLKAQQAFKKLQETFNLSASEARDLICSMYSYRYSLEAD